MSFQDEDIIAKRMEAKRAKGYTIEHETVVDKVSYTFARRPLFHETVSMVLPKCLLPMSAEGAREKFPSENRPQVILCNEDGSVTVGLSLLEKKAVDLVGLTAKEVAEQMKVATKRINPAFTFYKPKNFTLDNDIQVSLLSFTSYTVDMDVRNFYFAVDLNQYLILGIFGCKNETGDAWQPLVEQMMKSIMHERQDKEGGNLK